MKPEISAAAEFLSRIFLGHENIAKEKVLEFQQHLSGLLEERFRDHWHENCPTKGQAYRCIRVCPGEPLDPVLEKVCNDVGISVGDFNLPFELTLWVDPTEVVCKFGDLKCSYHTVAKKDHTSGNVNNQTDNLDIDDLVENARDLYLKKQTVVIHPIHSTEMHIPNPYSNGSPNSVTMAIRINGTMHYNVSGSPPQVYNGSPRGKGKFSHAGNKRFGGHHYNGKSPGGKGTYLANGMTFGGGSHIPSDHNSYQHYNSLQLQYNGSDNQSLASAYSNGYLNGCAGDENGYGIDQQSLSPPKMNGVGMSPLGSSGHLSQSPPTPEQIQQQVQHPPPLAPSAAHLQQAFSHPSTEITTLIPPPHPSSSSTTTVTATSSGSSKNTGTGAVKPSINGSSAKYQGGRSNTGSKTKQTSPVKDVK